MYFIHSFIHCFTSASTSADFIIFYLLELHPTFSEKKIFVTNFPFLIDFPFLIERSNLSSNTKLFAGDTTIFSTVKNVNLSTDQLNSDLEKISNWAEPH